MRFCFFFCNRGFEYINLSSVLNLDIVKNIFPGKLKIDKTPSVVNSFGKTMRNKTSNYKETLSSIDTNDDITNGTGIVKCDCQQHKDFVDENHGHVLTGDLKIITNSKLKKLVSKGADFVPMTINWNKCKREIDIALDSSIERVVSTNPKVTMEKFVDWKKKFFKNLTIKKIYIYIYIYIDR